MMDIRYGPAGRNVLDFWRTTTPGPNPLVIYIHGGGFTGSDKANFRQDPLIKECLDAGISFAAINYRFLAADVPLQDILHDCARALQFLRFRAEEFGIDPHRIAAFGSSGGAGTSMWLAFHDDLADPANPDPVLRESTRLSCAGSLSGQCSFNPQRWQEIFEPAAIKKFGGNYEAPQLLGFQTSAELETPAGLAVRADLDFINLISSDDPPVFIANPRSNLAVDSVGQFLHHPLHSALLYERCRREGVPVAALIPAYGIAPPAAEPASLKDFLIAHLKGR